MNFQGRDDELLLAVAALDELLDATERPGRDAAASVVPDNDGGSRLAAPSVDQPLLDAAKWFDVSLDLVPAPADEAQSPALTSDQSRARDSVDRTQAELDSRADGGEPQSEHRVVRSKKRRRCNPNRARDEQIRELRDMRTEVKRLTEQLKVLKTFPVNRRDHDDDVGNSTAVQTEMHQMQRMGPPRVWEAICRKQCTRRQRAQIENAHLHSCLNEQTKLLKSLQAGLHRSLRSMPAAVPRPSHRLDSTGPDDDEMIIAELIAGVDLAYREIDSILALNGISRSTTRHRSALMRNGEYGNMLDVAVSSLLPFETSVAADVVWQYYRGPQKHRGPLYFKSSRVVPTAEHETVTESFAVEMFSNNVRADFRTRQVLRRYFADNGREIVVWMSRAESTEITNKAFQGFGFREKGYVICDRALECDSLTVLQRCYRFMPFMTRPIPHMSSSAQDRAARAVIDFYLKLDNASLHQQRFENALISKMLSC